MSEFLTNNPEKQEQLKAIIQKLHQGTSVEGVKRDFGRLIKALDDMRNIEVHYTRKENQLSPYLERKTAYSEVKHLSGAIRRMIFMEENIFPQSPAIIGCDAQNCHPQKSVHSVNRILDAFKNKEKERSEFWLTRNGRFIHSCMFPCTMQAVRTGERSR